MTDPLVRPTIPIPYVAEIVQRCRDHARAVSDALAAASLAREALASPKLRISIVHFARFHDALVRALDDELVGYFARPVPRGAYATLLQLLAGTRDLHAMIEAAAAFYRLFDRHAYFELVVARGTATLTIHPRDAAQARSIFFTHSMLLSPWRTGAWLAAQAVPLREVTLPPQFRRYAGETRYLFGVTPRFVSGPPRLTFRAEHARLPIVRRADEIRAHLRGSIHEMLLAPPLPAVHASVRAVLAAMVPFADLDVAAVARQLGRSRATLARQLAQHGTSFQQLKDELRRDHAAALLTDTTLPLAEIADRLGYSEASAFQRAFREWTGVPPGALRRRGR